MIIFQSEFRLLSCRNAALKSGQFEQCITQALVEEVKLLELLCKAKVKHANKKKVATRREKSLEDCFTYFLAPAKFLWKPTKKS